MSILMAPTGRLMKHLASMQVVRETGLDRYRMANLSLVLSVSKYPDAFPSM